MKNCKAAAIYVLFSVSLKMKQPGLAEEMWGEIGNLVRKRT